MSCQVLDVCGRAALTTCNRPVGIQSCDHNKNKLASAGSTILLSILWRDVTFCKSMRKKTRMNIVHLWYDIDNEINFLCMTALRRAPAIFVHCKSAASIYWSEYFHYHPRVDTMALRVSPAVPYPWCCFVWCILGSVVLFWGLFHTPALGLNAIPPGDILENCNQWGHWGKWYKQHKVFVFFFKKTNRI